MTLCGLMVVDRVVAIEWDGGADTSMDRAEALEVAWIWIGPVALLL